MIWSHHAHRLSCAASLADSTPESFLPPSLPTERTPCGGQRQKKARHAQYLVERVQHPPGPAEHKRAFSLESGQFPPLSLLARPPGSLPGSRPPPLSSPMPSGSASESTDVLKDDITPSPAEQRAFPKSPGFSPLPGLPGDQLKSEFPAVAPPLHHRAAHAQVRKGSGFREGAASCTMR